MIYENGKIEVTCNICGREDYWDCGHLVAALDMTYCEVVGGDLYTQMNRFLTEIEKHFSNHLKQKTKPKNNYTATRLFENSLEESEDAESGFSISVYGLMDFIDELLLEAGAHTESGITDDIELNSSAMRLVYDRNPKEVLEIAYKQIAKQTE